MMRPSLNHSHSVANAKLKRSNTIGKRSSVNIRSNTQTQEEEKKCFQIFTQKIKRHCNNNYLQQLSQFPTVEIQNISKISEYQSYVQNLKNQGIEQYSKTFKKHQLFRIKTLHSKVSMSQSSQNKDEADDIMSQSDSSSSSSSSQLNNSSDGKMFSQNKGNTLLGKRVSKKMSISSKHSSQLSHSIAKKSIFEQYCSKFNQNLKLYRQFIQKHCQYAGIKFIKIKTYPKDLLLYSYEGQSNEINKALKQRWWWTQRQSIMSVGLPDYNLVLTSKKNEEFFQDRTLKQLSNQRDVGKNQTNYTSIQVSAKQLANEIQQECWQKFRSIKIHNHFDQNDLMKHFVYQISIQNEEEWKKWSVSTFLIKKVDDSQWKRFKTMFFNQQFEMKQQKLVSLNYWTVNKFQHSEEESWTCKPLNNFDDLQAQTKAKLVQSGDKVVFIQKQLSAQFHLLDRQFTINGFMLVTRLKGSIKSYFFKQGYVDFTTFASVNKYRSQAQKGVNYRRSRFKQLQELKPQVEDVMTFNAFQNLLEQVHGDIYNFRDATYLELKQIAIKVIKTGNQSLKSRRNLPCFQIFQLQYQLNGQFKPYLINIHSNLDYQPAYESSRRVIEQVINHSFKLSIDLLFPPPYEWPSSKRYLLPAQAHQNLFEMIFDQATLPRKSITILPQFLQQSENEGNNCATSKNSQPKDKILRPSRFTMSK